MRKIMILLPVLLAFATLASFTGDIIKTGTVRSGFKINPKTGYPGLWKKADSLAAKGLTRSVLDVVKVIYEKAKKDNNAPNFVKAVIYRLKFESYITEDDYIKAINDLTEEAKTTKYPIKPVIHSVLAEVYWRYYEQNRYQFLNRAETVNFIPADIRTWDLRKIAEKVIANYNISLENADSSKMIALNLYDDIIVQQPDSKKFRPTLYDFLAHRAVDFFMNQEPGLIRPADRYDMNDAKYFNPYDEFVKEEIKTNDTYALKFYANLIFQELLRFHMQDSNPEALIDAELKRLKFVKANSVVENGDSLYLDALRKEEKRFVSHPSSTEITYEIANYWYNEGLKYKPLVSDEDKWLLVKAYAIAEEGKNRFPDAFGAKNCETLQSLITTKSLTFNLEEAVVPGKPSRALVTYRNFPKVYVRIIKVDPQWDMKLIKSYYYGEESIKQYLKYSPFKEFSITLPDDKDYQPHSTEIKLPELPRGYYVVLMSNDENFSYTHNGVAFSHCWVSDLSYLKRIRPDGYMDFTVLDRTTGEPRKNVNAQLYRQRYNYTTRNYEYSRGVSGTTDSNGMVSFPPQKDYNYYYFYADFRLGGDQVNTDEFYSYYYHYDVPDTAYKTVFFLDRAIYRPGQTIFFKGIMLKTKGDKTDILPKCTTTVYLYDVNSQKQGEVTLVSNEYGTFDGSFTAPQGVLTGQMYLSNSYGYQYFSVEEYKRPKFEVVFEPVKGSYKLGQEVKVKGNAKAFAGSNIDNAEVKYRVVRTTSFPYWWYYWWGYYPASPQIEITNGTTTTDEKGDFNITFKAIPDLSVDKKSCPIYNYSVTADVTDMNGETRSSKINVKASNTALNLSVDVPAEIEITSPDKYLINTTNLSDEYVHTKGTIEIYKLKEPEKVYRSRPWNRPDKYTLTKEEFALLFPYDAYGNENEPSKYEKGEKVFNLNFDTGKDSLLSLNELRNWKAGYYVLEVKARDIYGTDVSSYHYFTLFSKKSNECPVNVYDWFTALKNKCEPGESAEFLIASKDTAKVFYEIERKGKIIDKKWISISKGQQKIELPVTEEYRGNVSVHFTFVRQNRMYNHNEVITVPYTNKELDITYETFRNKLLPGEKEEWKIKIKGKDGQKVVAEMLAGMYDASLDAFAPNSWLLNIYNTYYSQLSWEETKNFMTNTSQIYSYYWNPYKYIQARTYDCLNWFGFNYYYGRYYYRGGYNGWEGHGNYEADEENQGIANNRTVVRGAMGGAKRMLSKSANATPVSGSAGLVDDVTMAEPDVAGEDLKHEKKDKGKETGGSYSPGGSVGGISTRKNFNETAFFYPHLQTDENGSIVISFTMPEALTKWKFLGLATTKDLKTGYTEKEILTQKDLMIMTNPPRFLREGDKITFSAKISNLSKDTLCGDALLYFFDALTDKPIDVQMGNIAISKLFEAPKGQSTEVNWDIKIPEGIQAIKYKIYAKAGNFTDGEEMIIPVITNRMLVTETMPLPIRGKSEKNFSFDKLINSGNSTTLRNHKYTLEFTANPAWYAIQALPYLMEYPYECSEQTFDRFYANSVASHIANSHPRIKAVFDSWKNITPDALLSNLEKNQELKNALLEETPWVLQAKDESQRKRNVGILFDLNRMANELDQAVKKLERMQCPNGGWPWFKGMEDDRYITQYIVTGAGHLDKLGVKDVKEDNSFWHCIKRGVDYLDNRIREDYEDILKYDFAHKDEDHISYTQIQYLYARTYFTGRVSIAVKNQTAFNYFKGQAKKYWLRKNRYMQGMIALALNRLGDKITPVGILNSLKENAMHSEEMGMYWKDMTGGYYWYQAPIETQALLIEAFDEVANDQATVEELKVWLLKQKQTQDWKTTKATTEACYSLLLRGTDWLANEPDVSIFVGGQEIDPKKLPDVKVEAGTGYFKTSWAAADVKPEMGNVKVIKRDEGVSWGAVYWQYFKQLDKITPAETPLELDKKLFVERYTKTGPVIEPVTSETKLKVGDKLKVRIELRVDRDMEYIQLKDMRASGFEPINVISQYKYQDGLGYYEATGDAATNFFISHMNKGTYVFEYPLRVSQKGDFSNGITSIQCMYAPEFSSHSEGIRVKVE